MSKYNFSPGPAKLNKSVLELVEKNILEYETQGVSILEISHRSSGFQNILDQTKSNLQNLFVIPKNYKILFLQGGATFQNTFIANNINDSKLTTNLVTGTWGRKTAEDYSKIFNNLDVYEPRDRELETYLDKEYSGFQNIDFLHLTSNETIEGLQIQNFNTINHKNLIIDMSSDLGSYNFNFHNLSYVYAGAQKNMGIPGVTICLVKEEFLTDSDNPKYLNLKLLAKSNSILNTPPTMSIFVLNLVTNWMIEMGGIDYFQNKAHEQSTEIYDFIDNNSDVLDCKVENKFRSKSNIVFNFLKDEHNKEFVKLAAEKGIVGINGHRSVGGIRVSLFNSIDDHMFDYFMKYFKNYVIGIK